jgi:TonB family protein
MMLEADKAGRARAAPETQGGARGLLRFLCASVGLHGLLATVLLREVPAPAPVGVAAPARPAAAAEMVWFESLGAARSNTPPPEEPSPASALLATATPREKPRAPRAASTAAPEKVVARAVAETPAALLPAAAPTPPEPSEQTPASQVPSDPSSIVAVADALVREPMAGALGAESTPSGGGAGVASAGGGEGSPGAVAPGEGGTGTSAQGDLMAYARRLSSVVARERRYPASAARLGMTGTAHVQIRVQRDGSLAGPPRLVSSSGHGVLDAEALRMLEAAAPFAPLPESSSRPEAEFVIPVDFSLRAGG